MAEGDVQVEMGEVKKEEKPEPWTWGSFIAAVISLFCCPSICFGIVSVIFSVMSYVEYHASSFERFRRFRWMTWRFAIAGIVLGATVYLLVIIGGAVGGSVGASLRKVASVGTGGVVAEGTGN